MNSSQYNRYKDKIFQIVGVGATFFGLILLAIFIAIILYMGLDRLSWEFLTNLPSRFPEDSGIYTAWMGTFWILIMTTLISFPIGVGAGIYLEEYTEESRWATFLEINISNLAGVPSVIYGLLGLEVFVRMMQLGSSVLAGSLTLSLLILPIIIVSTREAIAAVPSSQKEASLALGATKWQTIWNQTLPATTKYGGIGGGKMPIRFGVRSVRSRIDTKPASRSICWVSALVWKVNFVGSHRLLMAA